MPLNTHHITLLLLFTILLVSCSSSVDVSNTSAYQIRYLDEYIFQKDSLFPNSIIGGLSGIEYDKETGMTYIICDDAKDPRYYKTRISIENDLFSEIKFLPPNSIHNYQQEMPNASVLDAESVRLLNNELLFASEGSIAYGSHPSIFITDSLGNFQYPFELPSYFLADNLAPNQPRHNAVFEGLAIDIKKTGFWAALELPLTNDGTVPSYKEIGAPTRVTHFNMTTRKADAQFAYPLDKLTKDPNGTFGINGVTALLQLDSNDFLILERGYTAGYGTQGNTVRIYLATSTNTTNILDIPILKNTTIVTAKKTLLFDFESIRDQLTDSIVDNLEGMTLGPTLSTGNPSLILVSDNNFNPPTKQLNQFILLELAKK